MAKLLPRPHPSSLDDCIQGQEIDLAGNILDGLNDHPDLLRAIAISCPFWAERSTLALIATIPGGRGRHRLRPILGDLGLVARFNRPGPLIGGYFLDVSRGTFHL